LVLVVGVVVAAVVVLVKPVAQVELVAEQRYSLLHQWNIQHLYSLQQ
jgi:hypothetical protein